MRHLMHLVAVAMIVEDGVSGGKTIGPRLQQLYTSPLPMSAHRKEESYERLAPKKMDWGLHATLLLLIASSVSLFSALNSRRYLLPVAFG